MSDAQFNGALVPTIAEQICLPANTGVTLTSENITPIVQRVKSSPLLRTTPIIAAESKKRKRDADEDEYANAFADTTNMHTNVDAPLSPSESPTKRRKKLTDEEKVNKVCCVDNLQVLISDCRLKGKDNGKSEKKRSNKSYERKPSE